MNNEVTIKDQLSLFPHAGVPEAINIKQVFDVWKDKGLTPIEITEEQFRQTISIVCDSFNGKLEWKTDNVYGIHALALMADTILSMYEQFIENPSRPNIYPGDCQIHIRLQDNRIGVLFDQDNDPQLLKGLLITSLCYIIKNFKTPDDINYIDDLVSCLSFNLGDK